MRGSWVNHSGSHVCGHKGDCSSYLSVMEAEKREINRRKNNHGGKQG